MHRKDESDNLIDKYNNFLLKNNFNKKEFENIFSEVIIKRINENKGNLKKFIDMESPFFDIISKTKIFENNYIIYISQTIIDEYKLKDVYNKKFSNLNKNNIKYSSIYYSFEDKRKIIYLNELNIDYNKINRLNIINKYSEEDEDYESENENENENDNNYELLLKFEKLEKLNLGGNEISNNIDIL